jgi:2-octaprenyl-3-methyl-6-methoxy-1,4-benzoquinol hydroxylase/2-octaprenylphenol hydroxylase
MSRESVDVVVIGGGMVGAATALALSQRGLDVRIVDRRWPTWPRGEYDLRVVALAPRSIALLDRLGVWRQIVAERTAAYRQMSALDGANGARIDFHADDYGWPHLGVIVENGRIGAALNERLASQRLDDTVLGIEHLPRPRVLLGSGGRLDARWVVAADGADSPTREQLLIDCDGRSYAQTALVAHLRLERPARELAWQRFLSGGPLALLPLADGRSSMVFSLPTDRAERLAADGDALRKALMLATDGTFGAIDVSTPVAKFPLRWQIARQFVQESVVLIGDAAHTVHPLAGQGVNLGLADVDTLLGCLDAESPAPGRGALARYNRERRSETMLAARTFDALNSLYAGGGPVAFLRGVGLSLVDRLPPLKRKFAEAAAGVVSSGY